MFFINKVTIKGNINTTSSTVSQSNFLGFLSINGAALIIRSVNKRSAGEKQKVLVTSSPQKNGLENGYFLFFCSSTRILRTLGHESDYPLVKF